MSFRAKSFRLLLGGITLAIAVSVAATARAQLGSVNNPPPQNLFNFNDASKPRDDGLGTMAERRRALARSKTRRPVHHAQPLPTHPTPG